MPSAASRARITKVTGLTLVAAALAGGWWLGQAGRSIYQATATGAGPAPAATLFGDPAPSTAPRFRTLVVAGLVLVVVVLAGGGWLWFDHDRRIVQQAADATGGDPGRAVPIMLANGCAGCHTIAGVPGAHGLVGPRLDGTLARRVYVGGTLPNTPANLIRWLRASREVDPLTAMPSTGISEQDARDVAAYLYALH
jgi:cytochrome c1